MEESDLERALARRFPSVAEAFRGLDLRVTVIMTAAAVLLLVFRKFGGSQTFEQDLRPDALAGHRYLSVFGDAYWFLSSFTMLGLVPFLITRPKALRPASVGLGLGDARFGLRWCAILYGAMLPVVVAAALTTTFSRYYPLNGVLGEEAVAVVSGGAPNRGFVVAFLGYEALYGVYFLGWEFFFRGFLTCGLYDRLGANGVLVGNIPFVLMHLGKPFPEALGSIFAGVALGLFALRARSFWYGFLLHVAIAWTMDAAAIAARALGR
jgi:hypothetical protein